MWMDWVWIGKGLIYRVKWVFLKLLGKLRELWEMSEVVREGFGEWEWFKWCEGVGKLGCFWKMNGNVVAKCDGSELRESDD